MRAIALLGLLTLAPPIAQRLDRQLGLEAEAGFSGAVLVSRRGTVLLDKAYGAVDGTPMRPSTRFWIASMGKQFTAAAVLHAEERGLLHLADPLSRFFPDAPADKARLTLLQLLTHQSGLPQRYVAQGVSDRSAAVRLILGQPAESSPGTRFSYSNDNYCLAAAALEVATGRRYEAYVRDALLRPSGLKDTGFAATTGAHLVAPARQARPSRLSRRDWGTVGAGGMFSTTRDLHAWYAALRGGKVLGPESVALLFTPYVAISEGTSGLGWFLSRPDDRVKRVFTRGNDSFGPNGLVYAYPDADVVVVILSHAGQKDGEISFSRSALAAVETILLAEP